MLYQFDKYARRHDVSEERINQLLAENTNKLIKLVPTDTPKLSDYNLIFNVNYSWSIVVTGLGRKLADSRSRAAKMKFEHSLTLRDLAMQWIEQKGRCALTGCIMTTSKGNPWNKNPYALSIDRINSEAGYIKGNIRLLCHWANNAKSTYDDSMFKSFIQQTANQYA